MKSFMVTVHFLDGRYHGTGDWPPSPARLFQAMVAGVAIANQLSRYQKALTWLETLPPPMICAPVCRKGQSVLSYVPNNDLDKKGGNPRRISETRTGKPIRPILFDSSVPLHYVWQLDDEEHETALAASSLVDHIYQLGRGVDLAWAHGAVIGTDEIQAILDQYPGVIYQPANLTEGIPLTCPHRGTLKSLLERHTAMRNRLRHTAKGETVFTQPPRPDFRQVYYNAPARYLQFELRETASTNEFAPWPLKEVTQLVQRLRGHPSDSTGAYARLSKHTSPELLNRILVGLNATDADKRQRVRIIPLPSIGHRHADQQVRRVMVEVPPNCPIRESDLAWAFSGLEVSPARIDPDTGEILQPAVELVRTDTADMAQHYGLNDQTGSLVWHTITPVVISRNYLARCQGDRTGLQNALSYAIMQALRHAGIRNPVEHISVQHEPFTLKGLKAEDFPETDRFFRNQFWHVKIRFSRPQRGPLLIGDGRYLGMGLFAPANHTPGILTFQIREGISENCLPHHLTHALRRATMARVQHYLGTQKPIAPFFTGHTPQGSPLRTGRHEHIAFAADLPAKRLLIIAPALLEQRPAEVEELKNWKILEAALADLTHLKAGPAGKLRIEKGTPDASEDPITGPHKTWQTITGYKPTRFIRKAPPEDIIARDVAAELRRAGLPTAQISVLSVRQGPRGGLIAQVRLTFSQAVQGPILLGKDKHLGGGLFAGFRS